jgi:multiple sugar transport system substrate-binding protein
MMVSKLVVVALVSCSLVLSLGASIVQPTYPPYTKQATIKWWSWTTNPQNVIKAFEKQYPSIHVVRENVGAGTPEYTKLLTAIKAGSGAPDLVQIEFDHLPQFIATGGLRDLAPLGANRYRPYFLPWTWNQVSQGRAVYAIPEDSGPTVLFYNAKIFAKYGLTVPRTWNDFAADAAKLHKANPHIYMSFFDSVDGHWFLSLAWAAGAHPFARTGANSWKVNLTSAPILKVTHFWQTLIGKGEVQPVAVFTADWAKYLADGRYASFVGAAWSPSYEIAPFVKTGTGWRAAPLPQWSTHTFDTGNWGGSTNAVTTQSKHPDAALLFAAWLNTSAPGLHYAVLPVKKGGRGLWPVDKYALEDEQLINQPDPILGGQRAGTIYAAASRAVDTSFQWSPWTTYFMDRYSAEVSKAVKGQESWDQALANMQAAVTRFAQQQGYTVTH